jgi:DAK2 domain fusion protein YloV
MAGVELLAVEDLRKVVVTYRDLLRAHQERINRLNVYPVPDGDTGTNMALTMESVVAELEKAPPDLAALCTAIAHGALMGGRGNSGVILSQVLRGISGVLSTGGTIAEALAAASTQADAAVARPIEGTILTVVRASATGAAAASGSVVAVLDAARVAAEVALAHTPEQLPVLKEAGVVDAGGAGFLLLLDAALHVLDGRALPEPPETPVVAVPMTRPEGDDHGSVSDLRFEVMYLLEAPETTMPVFKDVWAGIGDSIVVVGGDGLWNCHIHTNDIGAAIEAALDAGRPRSIRVTDLLEEVEEERWVREAAVEGEPELPPVATAVVAVATGDGLRRIFHSLGVQRMVAGGQSMNPSTAQLLEAVEAVAADEVVILPNNKNIIAVAQQVDGLTTKAVRVVPTRSVAEGFAALVAYDPDADVAANGPAMAAAAEAVVAGEVTQAVRDSGDVHAGDWIGIARDGILAIGSDVAGAATALLAALVDGDHELVTIIEGEGSSAAVTRRITEWLAEHHPGIEPEVHAGGQPLYPYLFGIE